MPNLLGILRGNSPSLKYPNGIAPYFGDGSDGVFNPAVTTSSGTLTTTTTSYENSGVVPNTSNANGGGIMAVALVGAYDGTQVKTIADASLAAATSYSETGSGHTLGTKFTLSAPLTISSFGIAILTAAAVTGYLVDNTGATLATVNVTSSSSGYTMFTLAKPITIPAGLQYEISVYSATLLAVKVSPNGTAIVVNFSNVPISTTFTFTAALLDGAPVIKNFTSINIPSSVTVTVDKRCQGLIMLCQGDATINGVISMDYLGPLVDPTVTPGNAMATSIDRLFYPIGNNKFIVIGPGGIGGTGGAGGIVYGNAVNGGIGGLGTSGTWFGGGRGGGGGGGAAGSLVGGTGGDAAYTGTGTAGTAGSNSAGGNGYGGAGGGGAQSAGTAGAGGLANGAGGAGGGGGCCYSGYTSGSGVASSGGAGGLILIIAGGSITINTGAIISAKGSSGANGGNANGTNPGTQSGGGGGGGGAGGGIVALLYRNSLTNNGTNDVSGGAGGTGGTSYYGYCAGFNGRTGSAGRVQTVNINS